MIGPKIGYPAFLSGKTHFYHMTCRIAGLILVLSGESVLTAINQQFLHVKSGCHYSTKILRMIPPLAWTQALLITYYYIYRTRGFQRTRLTGASSLATGKKRREGTTRWLKTHLISLQKRWGKRSDHFRIWAAQYPWIRPLTLPAGGGVRCGRRSKYNRKPQGVAWGAVNSTMPHSSHPL